MEGRRGEGEYDEPRRARLVVTAHLLLLVSCGPSGSAERPGIRYLADGEFYVQALGDRCLDVGPEASWAPRQPVSIRPCNNSITQRVRVKEIDRMHDVELRVQDRYCIGVKGRLRYVTEGRPLELQVCNRAPTQRFALDGDAILMGMQAEGLVSRDFAIKPERSITNSGTPLIVDLREASDAEYFRFIAVDGTKARPTTGFVTMSCGQGGVICEQQLDQALLLGWGAVIELDDRSPIRLSSPESKVVPAGVTIRGYRKFTYQGPEVFRCADSEAPAFLLQHDRARLAGFRLRGPMEDRLRCPLTGAHVMSGGAIKVTDDARVLIDHLEIGYWGATGVDAYGPGPVRMPVECPRDHRTPPRPCDPDLSYLWDCPLPPIVYPRETKLRVVRSFLHHIDPYGVVTSWGAFGLVEGNVFYTVQNHSIACDGAKTSGYLAYGNVFLSHTGSTDIDVHGSNNPGSWTGGLAGNYFDVGWNTALSTAGTNFGHRGTPCRSTDLHHNVFRQSAEAAIDTRTKDPARFKSWANTFHAADAVENLGVGDFDGDGIDDVFVGTGAAWYFSAGGRAEWRLLNVMPERASELRFGDFDGDRRTDVLALHAGRIDVSWAAASPWQTVNITSWNLRDLAVGDFDGDRHADLFLATGAEWFVAPGARQWAPYSAQPHRTPDLRFGDFTRDGKTDVVAAGRRWEIMTTHFGAPRWADLHSSLTGSLAGVVVADFTGDGTADFGRTGVDHTAGERTWQISKGGRAPWEQLNGNPPRISPSPKVLPLSSLPIGRFYDGNATMDVVFWSVTSVEPGVHFDYSPGGGSPSERLSRQPMR